MPLDRPLDRIDLQLLELLQNDARLTNKELAARVGLAPSTCLGRVQRLVQGGVVAQFSAIVDPSAVGLKLQAIVFVQFRTHNPIAVAQFQNDVLALPEVVQLYYMGGRQDLILHVVMRDTEHLRKVVLEGIASHPEVRHLETNIIFEHQRAPVPLEHNESAGAANPAKLPTRP